MKLTSPPGEWDSILHGTITMALILFPVTLLMGVPIIIFSSQFMYLGIVLIIIGAIFLTYAIYSKMLGTDVWDQQLPVFQEQDKREDHFLSLKKKFENRLSDEKIYFRQIDDPFPRGSATVIQHEQTGEDLIDAYEIETKNSNKLLFRMVIFFKHGKANNRYSFNVRMKNIDKNNLKDAWKVAMEFEKAKRFVEAG